MPYFARLENDFVIDVRVVDHAYMKANPQRYPGTWVETFLDGDDVKLMASPGFTYDSETGFFTPSQPFISWTFDEKRWTWVAPIPYPEDGEIYSWDESEGSWVAIPS